MKAAITEFKSFRNINENSMTNTAIFVRYKFYLKTNPNYEIHIRGLESIYENLWCINREILYYIQCYHNWRAAAHVGTVFEHENNKSQTQIYL